MSENISAPQGSTQPTPDMALDALDERLYDLTEEERTFFKQQTGIESDDELKAHLLQVQAEAYEVCTHEHRRCQRGNELFWVCSNNRFILTLAFASFISQSEFS